MPSLPSDALTVTCSNGLKQIASGYNGSFFSSLDGVTWSALPAAAVPWYTTSFTYFTVYDMVWIGTKFVAVGSGSTTVGGCATSPDGVTWTRQAGLSTAMTSGTAKAAAWNGSILVVVGNIPTGASGCATSPDGVTWTSRTGLAALTAGNSAQRTFQDVVWTGTKFVVVGDDANTGVGGFCATSPDGITWTKQAGFPAGAGMQLVWTGSLLVAIGANKAMATSPDGITWTASTSLSTSINDTNVQASTMASNGSSLVVIGTNTTTAAPVYFTSP
jgi:hypothetical protein